MNHGIKVLKTPIGTTIQVDTKKRNTPISEKERVKISHSDLNYHGMICRYLLPKQRKLKYVREGFACPDRLVIQFACDVCGVKVESLNKTNRTDGSRIRELVYARRLISVYLLSNKNYSLSKVGEILGGYNHATVIHHKRDYLNKMYIGDPIMTNMTNDFIALIIKAHPEYSIRMNPPQHYKKLNQES